MGVVYERMEQKKHVVSFLKHRTAVFNNGYDLTPFVPDERSFFNGRKRFFGAE